jgi:hypothetical protein
MKSHVNRDVLAQRHSHGLLSIQLVTHQANQPNSTAFVSYTSFVHKRLRSHPTPLNESLKLQHAYQQMPVQHTSRRHTSPLIRVPNTHAHVADTPQCSKCHFDAPSQTAGTKSCHFHPNFHSKTTHFTNLSKKRRRRRRASPPPPPPQPQQEQLARNSFRTVEQAISKSRYKPVDADKR